MSPIKKEMNVKPSRNALPILISLLSLGALSVFLGMFLVKAYLVREVIIFSYNNPQIVQVCSDGYLGEKAEADRRFRLKQQSELVLDAQDEDLGKELSQ